MSLVFLMDGEQEYFGRRTTGFGHTWMRSTIWSLSCTSCSTYRGKGTPIIRSTKRSSASPFPGALSGTRLFSLGGWRSWATAAVAAGAEVVGGWGDIGEGGAWGVIGTLRSERRASVGVLGKTAMESPAGSPRLQKSRALLPQQTTTSTSSTAKYAAHFKRLVHDLLLHCSINCDEKISNTTDKSLGRLIPMHLWT